MKTRELQKFINEGFGWVCKKCRDASKQTETGETDRARILFEGESESRIPRFSVSAMAEWADRDKQILSCPICRSEEQIPG